MTFFDKIFGINLNQFVDNYKAHKNIFANKWNYLFVSLELLLSSTAKDANVFLNASQNHNSVETEGIAIQSMKKLIFLNISRYAGKDFFIKSLKRNYQNSWPNGAFVSLNLSQPFSKAEQIASIIVKEIEADNSLSLKSRKITDVLQLLSQSVKPNNSQNTHALERIMNLGRDYEQRTAVIDRSHSHFTDSTTHLVDSQALHLNEPQRVLTLDVQSKNSLLLVLHEIENFPLQELDKLLRCLPQGSNILLISHSPNYFSKAKKTLSDLRDQIAIKLIDVPVINTKDALSLFQEISGLDFSNLFKEKNTNILITRTISEISHRPELVSALAMGFRLQKKSLQKYFQAINKIDLNYVSKTNSLSFNQSKQESNAQQVNSQSKSKVDHNGQINSEQRAVLMLRNLLITFPQEIQTFLTKIVCLPMSGFTANDAFLTFSDPMQKKTIDKNYLNNYLEILTYCGFLKVVNSKIGLIYSVESKIRELISNDSDHNVNQSLVNHILVKRLESENLWNESPIWITQYEQALTSLKWILSKKLFEEYRLFLLRFYRILGHKSLHQELEELILPICQQAIGKSKTNESRGFWYNLLGLLYREVSKFKDSKKYLELSLESFQKSLKFYNPQSQERKYSFVYQNIGDVYVELSKLNESFAKSVSLRSSIKAYRRALDIVGEKQFSESLPARKALASSLHQLGRIEKPSENYHKSFLMYKEAILNLKKNNQVSSLKLFAPDLEKLQKQVNVSLIQCSESDRSKLSILKKQIDELNLVSQ